MVYLSDIDNHILIDEVKKRPCLYVQEHPKYNDIGYEQSMWAEIAEKIFHRDWCDYSEEQKATQAYELSKRWQNIKEGFLNVHKQKLRMPNVIPSGRKYREYRYYNDVKFLTPYVKITLRDTENNESGFIPFVPYAGIKPDTTKITDPTRSEFGSTVFFGSFSTIDEELPYCPTSNSDTTVEKETTGPMIFGETPNHVIDIVKPANSKKRRKLKANNGKILRPFDQRGIYNKQQLTDRVKFALSLVPMLQMVPAHKTLEVKRDIRAALRQCLHSDTNNSNDRRGGHSRTRRGSNSKSNGGIGRKLDVS